MKKNIFVILYIACFLLLFSTEGKSQAFDQDVNNYSLMTLPPPVVELNQKESFNLFNDNIKFPLKSGNWDDDPNNDGTGLGELPVGDNLLVIILLLVTYSIFIAFRNRSSSNYEM